MIFLGLKVKFLFYRPLQQILHTPNLKTAICYYSAKILKYPDRRFPFPFKIFNPYPGVSFFYFILGVWFNNLLIISTWSILITCFQLFFFSLSQAVMGT